MTQAPAKWPRTRGNVWMLSQSGDRLDYMSDQFDGHIMGFEEIDEISIAQTPLLALGTVAMGSGVSIERPNNTAYPWHVFNEKLEGDIPNFAATSHAVLNAQFAAKDRLAYKTTFAISAPQAGITEAEALPGSPLYQDLMDQLAAAKEMAQKRGKKFHVDRVCLSLLAGTAGISEVGADFHYAAVGQELRGDVTLQTGQGSFPHLIVSQSAGSRFDGTSNVILAEGRLNYEHPTIGFIIATPKYPFDLMDSMPATHSPASMLLIDEIEHRALATLHSGQQWICPALQRAGFDGTTITAEFSTLSDLLFEDQKNHGFAVRGTDSPVKIKSASVRGKVVTLECDNVPTGKDAMLTYAWGETLSNPRKGNKVANQGSLRDSWEADSLCTPGTRLKRYALSGQARLISNTPIEWI